ncbi:hypothetical protein Kisp01_71530 [Kineosporia sp. NBRC 101677]|nr:hypothetical protein Kisp01_71530 [Kineosporia sp. NBRC 101677]
MGERFEGSRQLYTNLADVQYEKRLRALAHSSRTNMDEIGANNLYLALGMLHWKPEGAPLRSPLILVPVRLTRRPQVRGYHLELDESGASTPNFCLLEKLYQVHGMRVPGLGERPLTVPGSTWMQPYGPCEWRSTRRDCHTGWRRLLSWRPLQFAKFRLWKDLDENWEQLSTNTLVHHLIHQQSEPFQDPAQRQQRTVDLDELDAVCPLPGDAAQLGAVADAVGGRTFVLEGPPGTGKSQTITNMLTRAVVEGQRVLFVAEKRAALDVVRRRLDEVGMGPFCLDLHDKSSKPVHVRAQISRSLNHQVVVDEQDLRAAQQDLRSSRRALARYARGLHEPNAVGYSFYSAHTELIALGDGPVLAVPREFLHTPDVAAKVQAVRDLLRVLPDRADVAHPERQHPWGFLLLDDAASLDVERMREAAQHVDDSLGRLPADGPLAGVLAAVRTVEDFSDLSTVIRGRAVPLEIMDESRSQRWQLACGELLGELDSFFTNGHPVLKLVLSAVLDLPLDDIHAQAQQAGESSVIGRARRLRDVHIRLEPVLRPEADVRGRDLPELTGDLLQLREDVRALAQRARNIPGIDIPAGWNPFTDHGQAIVRDHVSWLGALGQAVDAASADPQRQQFIEQLRLLPALAQQIDDTAADAVDDAAGAVQALLGECGSTPELLQWWSGDEGLLAGWRETSAGRALWDHALHSLRRWVAFRQALAPLWGMRLEGVYDELLTGSILADDAAAAFERGLALAARTERGEANRLDVFDAEAHNRAVERFTTAAARVREHLKTALPAQVLERRTFDAATATGKAGALRKEIRRQRKGLGVRALMSEYGELVTEIMPCVLVSPDSLARFFPGGEQIFDLVVFDEASQIRVADAIGAMGRSRAVVVVGDSKQMPPTSFAQRSLGDEDDDDVVATEAATAPVDEESILTECVEARVPQKWLSWHYRSVDESLIAFSNLKYYEGRLSSFPTPNTAGTDCGISLVPVEGTYLRTAGGKMKRTNPQEAQAVVAEIRRRFDAIETPPSIGVVTFNAPQRSHIEDLIRDSKDERLIEALDARGPESLFIKNLENVQGDERDTILFSTGFSANEKGSLPRNFGPLVWFGGERRWNVAITRARRQVMVFSSFTPSQLKVEQTSSAGLQHLRAYLDIAAGDSQVLASSVASAAAPDKHREQLARALRGRGLIVQEVFGLSEFRVELALAWPDDPQTFLVAVLLDGQEWRHRKTVSDRDGLPVQVLSNMLGWPAVERVWLPEWLVSPENVLDRLEAATRAAAQARPARTRPAAGSSPARAAATDADLLVVGPPVTPAKLPARRPLLPRIIGSHQALPGQETYAPWQSRVIGDRKALDRLPTLLPAVAQLIDEIVEAEGPIHRERLARLVAAAFGVNRLVAARAEKIYAQLPAQYFKDPEEPFLWPAGLTPETWTTFRRQKSVKPRPLEQINRHEIGNAMVAIARFTAGLPQEQLLREVLGVFGARQMTDKAEQRLSIALERCLLQGRMIEQHGLLLVVEGSLISRR